MKASKFLVMSLLLTFISVMVMSQKPFSGVIKYAITCEGDVPPDVRPQLPTDVIVSYRDSKVRTEQVSPMYTMAVVTDYETGDAILMMDAMGQKVAVKQNKADIEKAHEQLAEEDTIEPQVKILDETKIIAGYKCKKAEVTQGDNVTELYFTDELNVGEKANELTPYPDIKGVLMEYTQEADGMQLHFVAKEVSKKKVAKYVFAIPDDYELKTSEEFGGMFGM